MSLCVLCPGQGSQSTDMLPRLLAEPLLASHLQQLISGLPFDALAISQDMSRCFLNEYAQPLIVAAGAAVSQALKSQGVHIDLSAGYSIGELTAHVVAGSVCASDALRLATARARYMDKAAPPAHGMMAVKGVGLDTLNLIAQKHGLKMAIVNDEQHAVLAGSTAVMKSICKDMERDLGAHVVHLNVSVPSHTPWLANATVAFRGALEQTSWKHFDCPVLSALDGSPVDSQSHAIDCLSRQISEPLQWARTLELSAEMGARAYFEIGPGNTLTRMVRERFPHVQARSLSEFQTFDGALNWLGDIVVR
ncbi:MAG: acyltransferase domain-containing protein [Gammaproteobacteria bacterium]|nr:acyltransferase domain-containing protein [Gammaproteobacteria bacterium]MBU0848418.1 acyltransferase domain-containing protein [Gammaproteobacteria bacterium]MBU1268179.1 acyltransferase domain-containing protein [Gammaproteobacteria bacterium]MBU1529211.1 acyltransferase domain-containing protein [Gammaproteobacteria bacterium]MBU1780373.1 acyltransferase domain-containing protein [Gammaproteobacteria bacterium]